jgi:RimJ/RimL family protein N-acetyltransferase
MEIRQLTRPETAAIAGWRYPGRYRPERLRLYVLDWNERSLRVAERHGFEALSDLENAEGRFLVMLREPALSSD